MSVVLRDKNYGIDSFKPVSKEKKPKTVTQKALDGYALLCNSTCDCGVLSVSLDEFDLKDRQNKHLKIKKVKIIVQLPIGKRGGVEK